MSSQEFTTDEAQIESDCNPDDSDMPSFETLMEWESEGYSEALDGCVVEPDGICPHGCKSWLLELGVI